MNLKRERERDGHSLSPSEYLLIIFLRLLPTKLYLQGEGGGISCPAFMGQPLWGNSIEERGPGELMSKRENYSLKIAKPSFFS